MIPLPIQYAEVERIHAHVLSENVNSLTLVSAEPQEGVSTVAYALARRIAAGGRSCLLVDLNLASPSVAPRLGVTRTAWNPMDDSRLDAIVPLGETGLSVLPTPELNQIEWSFRDLHWLGESIQQWVERFDVVILDASPLNRDNRANIPAELVAAASDGVVMVVRSGTTSVTQISKAANRLETSRARIIGAVINDRSVPNLPSELERETHRFDRILPGLMRRFRRMIKSSRLINQDI